MGRPHKKVEEKQSKVLIELDNLLGKELKRKKEILWDTLGYRVEEGNVIDLNLSFKDLKQLPESIGNLGLLERLYLQKNQFNSLPNSIGKLKVLQTLTLESNKLSSLPDSIGNLGSLQEFNATHNRLTTLPSSFGKMKALVELRLEYNRLTELPESLGNLKSLRSLDLSHNQLTTIPESIGKLKALQTLDLEKNKLEWIPETIGRLRKLEKLDISDNKLNMLPGFIDNLKNLTTLDIRRNYLVTLPGYLWRLQYLTDLRIAGNPLIDEWKKLKGRSTEKILEYCRQAGSVNVFFSYSLSDYESAKYPMDEIATKLKEKPYISYVYHCAQDMKKDGQIDKFMAEVIPHCQFVVFLGTNKSVKSGACLHELTLTTTHNLKIIPVLFNVSWESPVLKRLGLSKEFGLNYKGDVRKTVNELYDYIIQYKRKHNVFTRQEAELQRNILNVKRSIVNFLESDEFEKIFKKDEAHFKYIFNLLSRAKIPPKKYFIQCAEIISPPKQPIKVKKPGAAPKKTAKKAAKKTAKKSVKKSTKKAAKKDTEKKQDKKKQDKNKQDKKKKDKKKK